MGWSKRGSKRFYYRKVRTASGRWEKRYVGGGPSAEAAANCDAEWKKARLAERRRLHEERDRFAVAAAAVEELSILVNSMTRAALLMTGLYQHDRGPWRKRRVKR